MTAGLRRFRAWLRRDRLDAELADEIAHHLELRRRALIAEGLSPDDADAEARRQFGNVTSAREQSRDYWGSITLTALAQDVRFGLRMMTRSPGLSAAIVLIITLGAGVNSALFVVFSNLLRAPDVPGAESLVWLDDGRPLLGPTYPDYVDYRDRTQTFGELAAFAATNVSLRIGHDAQAPSRTRAMLVSGNYFATLGTHAAIGRTFGPGDDRPPAGGASVVISDGFWARQFNRDPSVLGRTIELNYQPFTVVGVLPGAFRGVRTPDGNPYVPDLWVPLWTLPRLEPGDTRLVRRTAWWGLQAIGRLREDLTLEQARARVVTIAAAMDRDYPEQRHPRAPWVSRVTGFDPRVLRTDQGMVMIVLTTAAMLVLLIACANVAGLLLARAAARRREIAVRMSLGAGRLRIVRQFLIEGAILSVAGTALGCLAASWVLQAVIAAGHQQALSWSFTPNAWTLAFAAVLACAGTLGTGLTPALQAGKVAMVSALNRSESPGVGRLRSILVGTEVAVSLVLVLATALLLRSVVLASTIDPGMPVNRLLAVQIDARRAGFQGPRLDAAVQAVQRELAAIPGVVSTALVNPAPFTGNRSGATVRRGDQPDSPGIRLFLADVSPTFFGTADQQLVRGRWFDGRVAEEVVINHTLAARLWPGGDPLGARLISGDFEQRSHVVVGVVRDTPYGALRYHGQPFLFRPGAGRTILVRTSGPAASTGPAAEEAVLRVDRRLVADLRVVADGVADELAQRRTMIQMAAAVGLVALLVALAGVGATASQSVAERTREIGIRMALGARRHHAVRFIVRRAMTPVVVGLIVGLAIATPAARVLGAVLYGLSPSDPVAFAGALLFLITAAVVSAWLPARRAAAVDPITALRSE